MRAGRLRPLVVGLGGASLAAVLGAASGPLDLPLLAPLPLEDSLPSFPSRHLSATNGSVAEFLRPGNDSIASVSNVSIVSDSVGGRVQPAEPIDAGADGEHRGPSDAYHDKVHGESGEFSYHKPPFPLDWSHDGLTIIITFFSLLIAAGGGIGGGGILVPVYMLVLGFHPKHAVALSNITILGGSIANTWLNSRRSHPNHRDRSLIDWDLIVIMEPLTIFGAVFGALMSKILPNVVLTVLLSLILAFMGHRTLKKGVDMWHKESISLMEARTNGSAAGAFETGSSSSQPSSEPIELMPQGVVEDVEGSYLQLDSDTEDLRQGKSSKNSSDSQNWKIFLLSLCFAGVCCLTLLKGGGHLASPLGFECGSMHFWWLYFASLPWVMIFAVYFRHILISEFRRKVACGYVFQRGEIKWSNKNTIKYPLICTLSGIFAGLFGIGGGIIKGPLMLEMGVLPSVSAASAAAMILYTSSAASTSFAVFGLLHLTYGAMFFVLGFVCTFIGQATLTSLLKKHKRESPIVLSIGFVIGLSSILVGINTVARSFGVPLQRLLSFHGVCTVGAG